jgi:hypothetical protein
MMQTAKDRWVDRTAPVAWAALTLSFFWKIALTNRILVGLDIFAYFYPYRDYISEALLAGRLPLWNPFLFMGAPLLANSQAAVLYPLHWPLLWLSTPKQLAWSIVLHIWLAGVGTYFFGRRALALRPWAAFVAAIIFALGGFLGAQVEHVNQLNASAWLPWLFLCLTSVRKWDRWRWPALLCGGAIIGLMLLAGHTQAAYIVLFGAGIYTLLGGLEEFRTSRSTHSLRGVATFAAMCIIGLALAAGQLLPTLELSRLSVRSSGMPYNEAASFSLKPGLLFKAFLPPLFWEPPFSEYIAYIGIVGLVLAGIGAIVTLKRKGVGWQALALAILGVFLAFGAYNPIYYVLYKLIPGFALFRAPARWLLLYAFGAALLAGIGLEAVAKRRILRVTVILLLLIELFVAGRQLAYNNPTTPIAFDSMRTSPAHLLADNSPAPFRFLSMSDIGYDPGDLSDLQAMYESALPPEAIYDLIVATKMKEVLAFNLPLRYRLFSVDGYDGGLLPISTYVTLEQLFLTEDEIWPDGRLRQQLRQVPQARLLSLLNVKYVITDKTQDVWIDDVFYDLEHTSPLGAVTLTEIPDFQATDLGLVSYLTGTAKLADGVPAAQVSITTNLGTVITRTLLVGEHTAEGLYRDETTAHRQARVGHHWRDNDRGYDYISVLHLGQASRPTAISFRSLLPTGQVQLRGLTLIDARTGTSRSISVNPAYRLVHSGDTKIYENLTLLSRAFVVHQAKRIENDRAALEAMLSPDFDPAREIILSEGSELHAESKYTDVAITAYEPEQIQIRAELDTPGYLFLSETAYPGWEALVDGQPAPIYRADIYFKAVALDAGKHQITFRFNPSSIRIGLTISGLAWLSWCLFFAITITHIGRKAKSSV